MKRIDPHGFYRGMPCSIVAVGTAAGFLPNQVEDLERNLRVTKALKVDGYLTLANMNKIVRRFLKVTKRKDFKRGERPTLSEWASENFLVKAVVCLKGHYIYFDSGEDYYSFFENENDEVVTVWEVEKE